MGTCEKWVRVRVGIFALCIAHMPHTQPQPLHRALRARFTLGAGDYQQPAEERTGSAMAEIPNNGEWNLDEVPHAVSALPHAFEFLKCRYKHYGYSPYEIGDQVSLRTS